MENQFETTPQPQEKTSQEVLQEQLSDLNSQYNELQENKSDYFDVALYDLYLNIQGMTPEARPLYIRSVGENVDEVLENYKKREKFIQELMAINEKRNIIAREINGFKDKEKEEERERKFNEEKDALTNSLYEALDGIHSQIPQEAKDVGMTTEMALKQYLPKLERKASKIEYWIERVEKSINMSELSFLKKQIGEESVE